MKIYILGIYQYAFTLQKYDCFDDSVCRMRVQLAKPGPHQRYTTLCLFNLVNDCIILLPRTDSWLDRSGNQSSCAVELDAEPVQLNLLQASDVTGTVVTV